MLRIGHKGADAIAPGNTPRSFEAAVAAGCQVIELDVLRPRGDFARGQDWRRAPAGPAPGSGPLLVAHDWAEAARREPLSLADALGLFTAPPLHEVRIDLDLKVAGREDEVAELLRAHGLRSRAMVSTMEAGSVAWLRDHEPELARGLTLPKVRRDWTRAKWGRPLVLAGMGTLRARLPAIVRRRAHELGLWAVWIYHPLITSRLVAAAQAAGVAVIAWTVDEPARVRELVRLGVDGICSNDPRILPGGGERPRLPAAQTGRP